jgi:hypothetical protein
MLHNHDLPLAVFSHGKETGRRGIESYHSQWPDMPQSTEFEIIQDRLAAAQGDYSQSH